MKKILFLLCTVGLFMSCSQNDDTTTEPAPEQMRNVTFEVKSKSFTVEVEPLIKSLADADYPNYYGPRFFQYIIYKESGEVYLNKVEGLNSINGTVTIEEMLPEGKYHVTILSANCGNPSLPLFYYIKPENYHTDYFVPNSSPSSAARNNSGAYYETFDLTVSETNEPISVELNPMWSVISFEMKQQQNMNIPEGTGVVVVQIDPELVGFYISTKKAKAGPRIPDNFGISENETVLYVGTLEEFLAADVIEGSAYTASSGDKTNITMRYYNNMWNGNLVGKEDFIELDISENNKRYNVHGTINKGGTDIGFGITINDYIGEEVDVPFEIEK